AMCAGRRSICSASRSISPACRRATSSKSIGERAAMRAGSMRETRHVVLFAKAPRLGAVKRRLAAGVGDEAALAFYRETLAAVARRLGAYPRWTLWLAV